MEHQGFSRESELVTTDQRQLDSEAVAITGMGCLTTVLQTHTLTFLCFAQNSGTHLEEGK